MKGWSARIVVAAVLRFLASDLISLSFFFSSVWVFTSKNTDKEGICPVGGKVWEPLSNVALVWKAIE